MRLKWPSLRCALLAALIVLPSSAWAQSTQRNVAVLCVGPDPGAVGEMQEGIEAKLVAERSVRLLRAIQSVALLNIKDKNRPGPNINQELLAKRKLALKEAERAFYEGRNKDALKILKTLAELQQKSTIVTASEFISGFLWQASAYLGLGDKARAESAALRALILAPNLEVNLNIFRPSLSDLIDGARRRGFKTAQVRIVVNAMGASIFVDDRAQSRTTLSLPIGTHFLRIEAPGFRPFYKTIDVKSATTFKITPQLILDPTHEPAFRSMLRRGDVSKDDEQKLEQLSKDLDVDGIIICEVRKNPLAVRTAIWWWDSEETSFSLPQREASIVPLVRRMANWVLEELRNPTGPPPPAPIDLNLSVSTVGGIGVAFRRYFLQSSQGGGTDVTFYGVGPRVEVEAILANVVGVVRADFFSYSVITPEVTFPDGSTQKLDGGNTILGKGQIGYQLAFGQAVKLLPFIGATFESHSAGNDSGRFPSYTRTAFDVGLRAAYDIDHFAVGAGGTISPFGSWKERPVGSTGANPTTGLSYTWRAKFLWTPKEPWTLRADYEGTLRSVQFTGASLVTFTPPMVDGLLQEMVHTVVISVDRSF